MRAESDKALNDKILATSKWNKLMSKSKSKRGFTVSHYLGDIEYSVDGFLV